MTKLSRAALLALAVLGGALAATAQDDEIGREFCGECHEQAEEFPAHPHGKLMAAWSPEMLERSCAGCHGPVELHLEEFSAESINRQPTAEACLTCHADAGGGMRLATPGHPRHGVACLDCHSGGHEEPVAEPLLLAAPRTLCGDCHGDVRAAFALPFTHRNGSETFACGECHTVHGGGQQGRYTLLGNGGVCITCHSDKAGPFLFPHPPGRVAPLPRPYAPGSPLPVLSASSIWCVPLRLWGEVSAR